MVLSEAEDGGGLSLLPQFQTLSLLGHRRIHQCRLQVALARAYEGWANPDGEFLFLGRSGLACDVCVCWHCRGHQMRHLAGLGCFGDDH